MFSSQKLNVKKVNEDLSRPKASAAYPHDGTVVFAKFFRAKNAIKQETDGSGLGLFIAKTIVEKQGGSIWFRSVEHKGTTFFITLPTA